MVKRSPISILKAYIVGGCLFSLGTVFEDILILNAGNIEQTHPRVLSNIPALNHHNFVVAFFAIYE